MMQASTVRRLRRPATIAQISSAAVLAAIVAFGAGQAQAQPMHAQGERGAQHAAHHRMAPGMGSIDWKRLVATSGGTRPRVLHTLSWIL